MKLLDLLVALLAEGVYRNLRAHFWGDLRGVALHAEGVDRNLRWKNKGSRGGLSPSSRRAWIEIRSHVPKTACRKVALLAEGVDRNVQLALN